MLKSTHRPQALPPGWTEHKAPSGHLYYYNAETKKSTYTRPALPQSPPPVVPAAPWPSSLNDFQNQSNFISIDTSPPPENFEPVPYAEWSAQFQNLQHPRGRVQERRFQERTQEIHDRPKSKHIIPGCAPWLLIKTKLKRRFVYNPDTNESLWKFPQHVIDGVVELDIQARKRKEAKERSELDPTHQVIDTTEPLEDEETREPADGAEVGTVPTVVKGDSNLPQHQADYDEDEYEEVEVTDDEDAENGGEGPLKRPRIEEEDAAEKVDQPIEFTKEDMADQLAQMGYNYDLDPEEYRANEDYDDYEEGVEGLEMTEEEAVVSFKELLNDYKVNPYSTWDQTIEDGRIVDDSRYTYLSTTKARKETFAEWSIEQVAVQKARREQESRQNPKSKYLVFLQKYATPKLYWPEFRRKFKKEGEMKDTKLNDKDRERLYREYVKRITQVGEEERKEDLRDALAELTISSEFNGTTCRMESLPDAILGDVRLYTLKEEARDRVLEDFARTLPNAEDADAAHKLVTGEISAAKLKEMKALREREDLIEREKRRQRYDMKEGRNRLREEEEHLRQAMNVGKTGLRDNLAQD